MNAQERNGEINMYGEFYVLMSANQKLFVEEVRGESVDFTMDLNCAVYYDDLEEVKELADYYGLIACNVNLARRFDCGVWKS